MDVIVTHCEARPPGGGDVALIWFDIDAKMEAPPEAIEAAAVILQRERLEPEGAFFTIDVLPKMPAADTGYFVPVAVAGGVEITAPHETLKGPVALLRVRLRNEGEPITVANRRRMRGQEDFGKVAGLKGFYVQPTDDKSAGSGPNGDDPAAPESDPV